jgi:hypothetical protein
MPPGPVPGTKLTEAYVRGVGQMAYFWAWPMVNIHNRKLVMAKVPEPGLSGGIVPVAPLNHLAMLHDYIDWKERLVACPNQDVVYGQSILDFSKEPVVVQVPDFGDRFWVYQACDQRTDGFANLGKMYGTKPGFYLLAGSDWKGKTPDGIAGVFKCPTRIGCLFPRVFQSDDPADKKAVQDVLTRVNAYPLSKFDGKEKTTDWTKLPHFKSDGGGDEEIKWVVPEKFFDQLPAVLKEVPPLPGEQALYAQVESVLAAADKNPKFKDVLKQAALDTEKELIKPLFEFRNYGIQLPHHWSTVTNGARFGIDYFTRTAVAKSNIFVNQPNETRYFYQDLDEMGERLDGKHKYTVTFPKGQLPPVKGFWSLTLYNEHHFFAPNELSRFSLGTKNKGLKFNKDGSLTLYVQGKSPGAAKEANWLPAPKGEFSLYLRSYWPDAAITAGKWTPPPVARVTN